MEQSERRRYLIRTLLAEHAGYAQAEIPSQPGEQKRLLRSLMNVRAPAPIGEEFLRVQDAYLRQLAEEKGVVELADLAEAEPGLYLWQGDITRLRCGAIVNAANSGMTGCYQPCHNCIDNCIHTYAGVQLRLACAELMAAQGHEEPTGRAKITPAFNLPCDYVIHTVGPVVAGRLTGAHREELASCYRACLSLAEENRVESVAFCCISTGVFGFPQREAARIAVDTVRAYRAEKPSKIKVIFNVFKREDHDLYRELLGEHRRIEARP